MERVDYLKGGFLSTKTSGVVCQMTVL